MTSEEREFLENLIDEQTASLQQLEEEWAAYQEKMNERVGSLRKRCRMIRQAYRNFLKSEATTGSDGKLPEQYQWMTELDKCVVEAMKDEKATTSQTAMTRREICAASGAAATNNRLLKRLVDHGLVITCDNGSYLSKKGVAVAELFS